MLRVLARHGEGQLGLVIGVDPRLLAGPADRHLVHVLAGGPALGGGVDEYALGGRALAAVDGGGVGVVHVERPAGSTSSRFPSWSVIASLATAAMVKRSPFARSRAASFLVIRTRSPRASSARSGS